MMRTGESDVDDRKLELFDPDLFDPNAMMDIQNASDIGLFVLPTITQAPSTSVESATNEEEEPSSGLDGGGSDSLFPSDLITPLHTSNSTYDLEDVWNIVVDLLDKNNTKNSTSNNPQFPSGTVDTPFAQDGTHSFGIVLVGPGSFPNDNQAADYEDRNWVVVGILIALITVLWFVLGVMLCVPLVRFIRRKMPVSKKRIDRRYETIEGWLITKMARRHDESCTKIQKTFPMGGSQSRSHDIENQLDSNVSIACTNNSVKDECLIQHVESSDTVETSKTISTSCNDDNHHSNDPEGTEHGDCHHSLAEDKECPICMEAFEVGAIVSWSAYEACSHVFHHECIKEWLLRHNNCPFCREIFLPVDQPNLKITMKVFRALSELRSRRAEKTFYCAEDGLVTLGQPPNNKSVTAAKHHNSAGLSSKGRSRHAYLRYDYPDQQALKDKLKAGITKADLKTLRGNRCEKSSTVNETPLPDIIENPDLEEQEERLITADDSCESRPLTHPGGNDGNSPEETCPSIASLHTNQSSSGDLESESAVFDSVENISSEVDDIGDREIPVGASNDVVVENVIAKPETDAATSCQRQQQIDGQVDYGCDSSVSKGSEAANPVENSTNLGSVDGEASLTRRQSFSSADTDGEQPIDSSSDGSVSENDPIVHGSFSRMASF